MVGAGPDVFFDFFENSRSSALPSETFSPPPPAPTKLRQMSSSDVIDLDSQIKELEKKLHVSRADGGMGGGGLICYLFNRHP
jgi:hypothetical protein